MDLTPSERSQQLQQQVTTFMDEYVLPAEQEHAQQFREGGPRSHPPIMEDLKKAARAQGLWNLFLPGEHGAGLTNLDYAPIAEITGRSLIAPEALNCSAPDTGNMEILSMFGTAEQQEKWLKPLLEGEIRSAFCMTEPAVASSDATRIGTRIKRDGDSYVITGHKWWATNVLHPHCKLLIVMGKTDPDADRHRQQSMILVPLDTPGIEVVRGLTLFGIAEPGGHAEVRFNDVRVPASNILAGEGEGFAIAQARLGPGRIHHCMRVLGHAERALEMMCRRARLREPFGKPLAERDNVQEWITDARLEIERTRLLVLSAAALMDASGNKAAHNLIQLSKIAAPRMAQPILDRAMQVHGALGLSPDDAVLAEMWAQARALDIADGPTQVHSRSIALRELRKYDPEFGRV